MPKRMLFRMMVFGIVFTTVLLLSTWLAAKTWAVFADCKSVWWIAIPMIVVGAYVPVMLASFAQRNAMLDAASVVTSVAMGVLNYAFFAALACWLVYGVTLLFRIQPDTKLISYLFYAMAILASLASVINAANLRTTRVTIHLSDLPESWRGKEIALVSDIHLGRVLGHRFSEQVVQRLESLSPYAVFIAGDIFDGPESQPDALLESWKRLKPPAGIYFASGNHDEFGDIHSVKAAIGRAGIRVLSNEKMQVDGMQIVGIDDNLSRDKTAYTTRLKRLSIASDSPAILVFHQPVNLDIAASAGVSLQLSGHTHGGQFWPWNYAVDALFGPAAHGLSRHGGLQLYTSYGAGTWGPPMRLFTRPEIVLLKLERE